MSSASHGHRLAPARVCLLCRGAEFGLHVWLAWILFSISALASMIKTWRLSRTGLGCWSGLVPFSGTGQKPSASLGSVWNCEGGSRYCLLCAHISRNIAVLLTCVLKPCKLLPGIQATTGRTSTACSSARQQLVSSALRGLLLVCNMAGLDWTFSACRHYNDEDSPP